MIGIGAQLNGLERTLLEHLEKSNAATAESTLRADDGDEFIARGNVVPQLASLSADLEHVDAVSRLAAESQLTLDLIRTQIGKIGAALLAADSNSLDANEQIAKQKEIDAAIFAIDNLARVEIDGRRILDGSLDYQTCGPIQFPVRTEGVRPNVTTTHLGGQSGMLADLRTGGLFGDLGENTSLALIVVDEALVELNAIEDRIDNFADSAFALSAALLSGIKTTLEDSLVSVNKDEETLRLEKNRQLSDNVLASLAILSDQRAKIVQLLERMPGLDI